MSIRIILFCITAVLGFAGPVWIFIPMLIAYILMYVGIEVLVVAVCIDAYFGYGSGFFCMYTLCTGAGLLAVHVLRPMLFIYSR